MNRDQLREAVLGTAAWNKAGILTESAAPVQEQEVIEEAKAEETAPEAHTCPLCESTLEGELSDEVLLEHAQAMLGVFEEAEQLLAEAEEAEEGEVIEEEEEVDLLEGLDEDEVDEVVAFVNEMYGKKKKAMKAAKKGKMMEKEGEDC
jgi:DNA repair exonuclease SbcCD ATPase subunit